MIKQALVAKLSTLISTSDLNPGTLDFSCESFDKASLSPPGTGLVLNLPDGSAFFIRVDKLSDIVAKS